MKAAAKNCCWCCGDNYIKLLVRNQEKLRGAYVFECISEELLMRLSIKESFYQCAPSTLRLPQDHHLLL